MVQFVRGVSFSGTAIEIAPLIGGITSIPWPQVKELRRGSLGFTSLRAADGRKFIIFIGPKEIETLIGILRETSDARIYGER
jgi:hypothetical protein